MKSVYFVKITYKGQVWSYPMVQATYPWTAVHRCLASSAIEPAKAKKGETVTITVRRES